MSAFDDLMNELRDRAAMQAERNNDLPPITEMAQSVHVFSVGLGIIVREDSDGNPLTDIGMLFNGGKPYLVNEEAVSTLIEGLTRLQGELRELREAGAKPIPPPPSAMIASMLEFAEQAVKRGKTPEEAIDMLGDEIGTHCPCDECTARRNAKKANEASLATIISQIESEIKAEDSQKEDTTNE